MEKETVGILLNVLIFLPLLGIPLILASKKESAKYVAMIASLIPFALSILIYQQYIKYSTLDAPGNYVFQTAFTWFRANLGYFYYDVNFLVGVDGVSIYLVMLTTLLFPLSIWFSWSSISEKEKAFYSLILLLEVGTLGVFLSLDLLIFYIFFEIGLIPMYFLIGIWGGKGTQMVLGKEVQSRQYAAVKFFLYTLVGSFLMLIALLFIGNVAGQALKQGMFTTDFPTIAKGYPQIKAWLAANGYDPFTTEKWLFLGFFMAFAIKVPLFPMHTWLPDAHTQAPTAGSVLLAGLLLKMGTYGLIRFCLPLFPEASAHYAGTISFLSIIGITYGAMAAMVQSDIKKLVAYSSVAHMGFVMLGIFAMNDAALRGAVIQMINHGVSTGALFLLVGMIYDRTHTREISSYQGVAKVFPIFTLLFMITTMSSIGLPGLNGFVGEFLILIGAFKSTVISNIWPIIATSGVIIAAVYMLWMFRRVMFGAIDRDSAFAHQVEHILAKIDAEEAADGHGHGSHDTHHAHTTHSTAGHEEHHPINDLNRREVLILMPLIILMFVMGFYAAPFLSEIGKSSDTIVNTVLNSQTTRTITGL